jgi:hypothetical protein
VRAGGGASRVGRIFSDFLHLSRFHLLQIDKSTNKSLPSGHLPQSHKQIIASTNPNPNQTKPKSNASISLKPTNRQTHKQPQTQTHQKRRENERESGRERKRERKKKKTFKPFLLSIISSDQIVEDQWL